MTVTPVTFIFIAVLGAIIGSFFNAFSFRFHAGKSILTGRSRCMRCGHQLSALDLIPILSFLWLKGKCRYCKSSISLQYPLIEVLAAALSIGVYLLNPAPLWFLYWFVVWMLLLFVVVYDIRHTIIPIPFFVSLLLLAIIRFAFVPISLSLLLAGPLVALPLLFLSLISKGMWMGWGDGLLELSIGWLLGLWEGISALLFGFWIGAAIGLLLLFASSRWNRMHSRFTMKSEIPLAPFLIGGMAVVYFFHVILFIPVPGLF